MSGGRIGGALQHVPPTDRPDFSNGICRKGRSLSSARDQAACLRRLAIFAIMARLQPVAACMEFQDWPCSNHAPNLFIALCVLWTTLITALSLGLGLPLRLWTRPKSTCHLRIADKPSFSASTICRNRTAVYCDGS